MYCTYDWQICGGASDSSPPLAAQTWGASRHSPRTSCWRRPPPARAPSRSQRTIASSPPPAAQTWVASGHSPRTSCCIRPPPPRAPSRSQRTTPSSPPTAMWRLKSARRKFVTNKIHVDNKTECFELYAGQGDHCGQLLLRVETRRS